MYRTGIGLFKFEQNLRGELKGRKLKTLIPEIGRRILIEYYERSQHAKDETWVSARMAFSRARYTARWRCTCYQLDSVS